MTAIPQGRGRRRIWTILALLFCASSCFGDSAASSQTQRRIGEARLQDELSVSLTFGTVRAFNSEQLVLRSASPLVEITFEAGPTATGPIAVELRNQHRRAELRVATAEFLDAEDIAGCPVVSGVELDCVAGFDDIGRECETSGQCAEGLRCADSQCVTTNLFEACAAPDFDRISGQETSLRFDMPADPCRRVVLETVLLDGEGEVRFGVVGPSRDVELVAALGEDFRARELDFVILLGDNIAELDETGLAELERVLAQLGTPVVVIAGNRELVPGSGAEFLRRFGPHDHVWELEGNRFFAFFSAPGSLGPRGLERLNEFLLELTREDGADAPPLIGATHVPPFDSNDARDNAFRSEFEASQLVSLLESHGVHQLYAGGMGTGYERIHNLETFITTASGTLTNPTREWITVVIAPDADGRPVGERAISVERISL